MAGWALFAGIAAAALALLALLRFPRGLKLFACAAAVLGAAGYAWQGNPGWAGRRAAATAALRPADDDAIAMRSALFGRYGTTAGFLIPADAMLRIGEEGAAARFIQGGINREPGNVALWTQLGSIIARHDQAVSPAALVAFHRAMALAPRDPAPWFLLGQAQVDSGAFMAARKSWGRALSLAPAAAGYRPAIARRVVLLDRYLATVTQ